MSLTSFVTFSYVYHTTVGVVCARTSINISGGARPGPAGARAPVEKGCAPAVPRRLKWAKINRVNAKIKRQAAVKLQCWRTSSQYQHKHNQQRFIRWDGFMEKVSFESGLEWNWDGVMHNESGDDDNDDELVRQRWDDGDLDSSSTGLRSSLESLFQRQGEAQRKERLLTFKEEYKDGWARVTTSEEGLLQCGWRGKAR